MTELEELQMNQILEQDVELRILREMVKKGPWVEEPLWLSSKDCLHVRCEGIEDLRMAVDFAAFQVRSSRGFEFEIIDIWYFYKEHSWNIAILFDTAVKEAA